MPSVDPTESPMSTDPVPSEPRHGPTFWSDVSVQESPSVRHATICQVLHGLQVGGAEILAARLARQLNRDYRFLFICLDELGTLGQELRFEGFSVQVVDRRPGLDRRSARRLAGIIRRERVDVLHAHQYTPFFYCAASRLIGSRPPILFSEHGRHQPDYPRRKRILANRVLLEAPRPSGGRRRGGPPGPNPQRGPLTPAGGGHLQRYPS